MPEISILNERLKAALKHDMQKPECTDCPNLQKVTNGLGRTVLKCGLYESLSSPFVGYRGEYGDKNVKGRLKAGTVKAILAGQASDLKGFYERQGNVFSARTVVPASADSKGYGSQVVVTSDIERMEKANDDCPVIATILTDMAKPQTEPTTQLYFDDPIIRPQDEE